MNHRRLEHYLREYVRARLLAPRGLGAADFRLVEPPTGVTTCIRLVDLDAHPGFALRVYPWLQRWRARRRLEAARLIERHGLPAPRIVDHCFGSILRGPAIVAEERLTGAHVAPGQWSSDVAARLAEALARLHAVSSARHGPVDKPISGPFFASLWSRVRHRLRGVRRRGRGRVSSGAVDGAERWFRGWAGRFAALDRFDLLHDKLNPGNVLWLEGEGRFALLDFETLQFGCRVKDLVQAEHDVLFGDEEPIRAFRARYMPSLPDSIRGFCEGVFPFFHAYYHLSEAATSLKRGRRAQDAAVSEAESKKLARHWAELDGIIRGQA